MKVNEYRSSFALKTHSREVIQNSETVKEMFLLSTQNKMLKLIDRKNMYANFTLKYLLIRTYELRRQERLIENHYFYCLNKTHVEGIPNVLLSNQNLVKIDG